jgi:catechol 2,3-dioxygenase-like lactoylglutathione lyase family enzyme
MYDHIGLHVRDLERSIAFYEAVLAPFGYELCSRDSASASFGPPSTPALYLYLSKSSAGAGTHVALRAKSAGMVRKFHAAGLRAGGHENGGPGVRTDYAPTYYAAFLLDPDGNNVEAVCTEEQ